MCVCVCVCVCVWKSVYRLSLHTNLGSCRSSDNLNCLIYNTLTDPIISEQLDQTNKRKRDILSTENLSTSSIKSMSQLSIASLVVTKKIKHLTATPPSSNSMNTEIDREANSQNITFYKPSKYLKMPRRLLLHSLHLQLHCSLKKKKEQIFLLSRLQIIDQQFCLEQIRSLYQVYSDCGSSNHVWPVS